jgi:hypothetical protein
MEDDSRHQVSRMPLPPCSRKKPELSADCQLPPPILRIRPTERSIKHR